MTPVPKPRGRPRDTRTERIMIRLSTEERVWWEARAREVGMTLSAWIRLQIYERVTFGRVRTTGEGPPR